MEKQDILNKIVNLSKSSFVDENYTPSTIHQLFDDCVEFAIEELEDYGISYTIEEITKFFEKELDK